MTEWVQDWVGMIEASLGPQVDWKQVVLIGMTPVFVLAFALEWQVMRRRGQRTQFHWKEIAANLSLGASYQVFEVIAHGLFVATAAAWFYRHRLFDLPVNGWTILPIFVVVEFCYYWFHRTSHRVRWFWSAHVVHHSGEHMNFTMAMRQSLLYPLTGWWLFFMPLVLLGLPPGVVFFLYAVDLSYQYFVHTDAVGRLPSWIEYVFDTPANHRVHHGRNPQYIDKNYGGVLIVFDRWFGTWEPELEPEVYGIPRQVHSYNPLTLNFHEFIDMWKDVLRPGPLALRLKHLWAPPEWVRPAPRPRGLRSAPTPAER
ncbi:MAG: sterol desaturase family protein [Nevskia sp.]|nr:sterol desaturase family protein [Nevskia sp.]